MDIKTIGVVGGGQMGSGIAQVSLMSGFNVLLNGFTPTPMYPSPRTPAFPSGIPAPTKSNPMSDTNE